MLADGLSGRRVAADVRRTRLVVDNFTYVLASGMVLTS
jgi:hypothetical protein